MTPPHPKRPPRAPRPPGEPASCPEPEVELPFDDDEVAPLRADDPRPQHVPQFPAGSRRRPRRDRELPAPRFTTGEHPEPGLAPASLYVERGPGAGQLLPLAPGSFVLGRASTSELRLQHPSISRRHAQLTRVGDRLTLKDLGSQNGTFVNHCRISSEVELHSGDEITLGNALLSLRGPGPRAPRAPSLGAGSSLRVGRRPRRRTLLAATLGALLAVFVVLGVLRLVRERSTGPRPSPVELAPPASSVRPAQPSEQQRPVGHDERHQQ